MCAYSTSAVLLACRGCAFLGIQDMPFLAVWIFTIRTAWWLLYSLAHIYVRVQGWELILAEAIPCSNTRLKILHHGLTRVEKCMCADLDRCNRPIAGVVWPTSPQKLSYSGTRLTGPSLELCLNQKSFEDRLVQRGAKCMQTFRGTRPEAEENVIPNTKDISSL